MSAGRTADCRDVRVAKNQAFFREIEARVRVTGPKGAAQAGTQISEWLCECTKDSCTERVQMAPDEYEAIRQVVSRYLIAPDDEHFSPDTERVVEHHERYWVVQAAGEVDDTSARRPITLRT